MKKSITMLFVFLLAVMASQNQAQCPGCVMNLGCSSSPAYPTICPDTLPDGMAGQPYDEDVSFWMPTNFNDPGTGLAVTLDVLVVVDMVGLPFGLDWQTNALADNTYYPSSNPPATEYGCAKICGTPVFPGTYYTTVYIHAEVGTVVGTQVTDDSFIIPLTILPDTSGTASFSIINSIGCGSVTASFLTNIPSNGQNGYSYNWNFGNGLTSNLENPPDQTYNTPGTIPVSCSTVVDTLGFNYLTNITVLGGSCNDSPFSSPDFYVKVFDPSSTLVYQSAAVVDQNPPVSFSIPNIQLTNQNYTIETWDEDGGLAGSDDFCSSFVFNGLSAGTSIWNGQDGISYVTTHPVFTFVDTAYVTVYPSAPTPVISLSPNDSVCNGDTITLSTLSGFEYQWNNDTVVLLGGNSQYFNASVSGSYWVMIMDTNGCSAVSSTQAVVIKPVPAKPAFWKSNDTLRTLAGYTLQWYLDGAPIAGANAQFYVISASGYYSLSSTLNGCTSWSDSVYYIYSGNGIFENSNDLVINVMPNPFSDKLNITVNTTMVSEMTCRVYDVLGNCIMNRTLFSTGQSTETIDFSGIPAGVYFLYITGKDRSVIRRLLKTL